MRAIDLTDYPNVIFGENVSIQGTSVIIKPGSTIGDNVIIHAKNIEIGFDAVIEKGTVIRALGVPMETFRLGDNCLIGFSTQILVPYFEMGDYSQLHNSSLCSGYKPLNIGNNCWIGQGAILNSFETLTLGNNVRMGGSQIWTHVASGELLEGSNFYGSKPVTVEDNVWLMGFGHLVTPGVVLAKNSVIMAGSVVTKSTLPYKTYSGNPARDISDKLPAWKKLSGKDKIEMMQTFISDFKSAFPMYAEQIYFIESSKAANFINVLKDNGEGCVVISDEVDLDGCKKTKATIFDISTKRYLKQRSGIEICWIRFNLGFRSRFIPFK